MNSFYWSLFSVSKTILRALALGIGLDESHLLKFHSGLNNQLRLLHYPSIPAAAVESGRMVRMPAHSDWSSMTMLFQDDCGGLEVEDPKKPGTFIAAMPMEGAIVMNVGDLLQHWSNGTSPVAPIPCFPSFRAPSARSLSTVWDLSANYFRLPQINTPPRHSSPSS